MESENVIKYLIRYSEYEKHVNKLLKQIKESNIKFDYVYGIPRGGLPLGVEISHKLEIPLNLSMCIDENKNFICNTDKQIAKKNILIVDDLVDSGTTMYNEVLCCSKIYENVKTAVLFKKPWSIFDPDFYVFETDKWIVFPYENPEEIIPEKYLKKG